MESFGMIKSRVLILVDASVSDQCLIDIDWMVFANGMLSYRTPYLTLQFTGLAKFCL